MSVWKRQALRAAQAAHRLGTFGRLTRGVVWKWPAGGAGWGVVMAVMFRQMPLSRRSFWLGLVMWVTVGTVVFALTGVAWKRFFRAGLRAMRELRDRGYCPFCSYDLQGAPTTRCSECGRAIEELDPDS